MSIPDENGHRYLSLGTEVTSLSAEEKEEGCSEAGGGAQGCSSFQGLDFSTEHPSPNIWPQEQLTLLQGDPFLLSFS